MHGAHNGTGGVSHSEVAWAETGGSGTLRPVEKLWIGGEELSTTEGLCYHNASDKQAAVVNNVDEGANAILDPKNGILTLNNLNVQTNVQGIRWGKKDSYGSSYDYRNLVIRITGTNSINASSTGIAGEHGYDGKGPSLRIEGNGSLSVTSGASGIWVWKDITIEGSPTIDIVATSNGIANNYNVTKQGSITIKGGALTIKGAPAMGLAPTFYPAKYRVTADTSSDGKTADTYNADNISNYKYLKFTKAEADPVGIYLRTIGIESNQPDIIVPKDQRSSLGTPYYWENWVDYGTFESAKAASFDETKNIKYYGEDVKAVIAEMNASTITKKSGVGFSDLNKVVWDNLSWSENADNTSSWHLNGAIPLCRVNFDLNYPEGETETETKPATRYAIKGSGINTGFPTAPSCTNYTFAGWYTAADAGGSEVKAIPNLSNDVTYYAHWSENTPRTEYTITWDASGGKFEDVSSSQKTTKVQSGGKIAAPDKNPTKESDTQYTYTFEGWYEENADTKVTEFGTASENITYYAHYTQTPREYSVTLNLDGGTLENGKNVTSYTCGTEVTLPTPTKEGYNFGGWYDNSNCTGNPVTEITATDTGNKEFWAQWTDKPAHNHSWAYSKTAEDTIAAACTSTAGTCEYNKNGGTITIKLPYSGYQYDQIMPKAEILSTAWHGADITNAADEITYQIKKNGAWENIDKNALKNVGEYKALYTLGDLTISIEFSIGKADHSNMTAVGTADAGQSGSVDLENYLFEFDTMQLGDLSVTDDNNILDGKPSMEGTVLKYKLKNTAMKGQTVLINLSVIPQNCKEYQVVTTVTVGKNYVSGTPGYTKITESGKTLKDAALICDNKFEDAAKKKIAGTIKWIDADTKAELPLTTEVVKDQAYTWIFAPSDEENYQQVSGRITLFTGSTAPSGSGTGGYYTPSSAVTTSGSTDSKVTSSPTEVKRETKTDANGSSVTTATVTVSAANQREILRQAKANKSGEIVIKISQNDVKDAAKIALQLEKSFIEAVVTDTDAKLIIQTPDGERTFTQDELKKLAAEATDKIVTVDPAEAEQAQPEQPADTLTPTQEKLVKGVENTNIDLRSQRTPGGNILLTWAKEKGYKVDYFEIYRSTKRSGGYGRKPFFRTPNGNWTKYLNTKNIKEGSTYYYKIRGVRIIDGKKYYTEYSTKAWRSVK